MLRFHGRTESGAIVVGGVYAFFETHGVPLSDIIASLRRDHNMMPDWTDLVLAMMTAGRSRERAIEAVSSAVRDAGCFSIEDVRGILGVLEHPRFADAIGS